MEHYLEALREWKNFHGRVDRKGYWMFILINMIIGFVLGIVETMILKDSQVISSIYSLVLIIPSIAINTRRLHDIGKSGWWQLITIIPVIGWIWFIILMATDTKN